MSAAVELPPDWHLVWCPDCLYSVSFTQADAVSYQGDEWLWVCYAACRHECPAAVRDGE